MDIGNFIVVLLNFIYIGLLPIVFFKRDGKLNAMWWLTAAPFLISIGSVMASLARYVPPVLGYMNSTTLTLQWLSVSFCMASVALISFTLGTHRIPIALWHQSNDAPKHIVTWGAYKTIRHPFYASFLLAFVGALLYSPQALTLAALVWGLIILNKTAAAEEQRLSTSEFDGEYTDYIAHTGRFIPRWSAKAK